MYEYYAPVTKPREPLLSLLPTFLYLGAGEGYYTRIPSTRYSRWAPFPCEQVSTGEALFETRRGGKTPILHTTVYLVSFPSQFFTSSPCAMRAEKAEPAKSKRNNWFFRVGTTLR